MNDVMQTLFNYILDTSLETYYKKTKYAEWSKKRDAVGRKLWEQLTPDQRTLLEELQQGYDRAEICELEAMFLAAFDQCMALTRAHSAEYSPHQLSF